MNSISPLFASLLVLFALCTAAYFAWQQVRMLRGIQRVVNISPEDRLYFRRQAWRRLAGCVLLAAVGVLIAWPFLSGIIERFDALAAADAAQAQPVEKPLDPDQKRDAQFLLSLTIAALLLLMALLFIAAWDVWAIRGYGARHYRRIQEDRREMIQRQLVKLRKERGHHRNGSSDN